MMRRNFSAAIVLFCLAATAQKSAAPVFALKADAVEVAEEIELPDAVSQAILNDAAEYPSEVPGRVACQKVDTYDASLDATYRLLCVRVHLAPAANDLFVMGIGDYRGDNSAPYWLFHNDKLVFKTRAAEVDVRPEMSGGFSKLEAQHVKDGKRTVETFVFDGVKYSKQSESVVKK